MISFSSLIQKESYYNELEEAIKRSSYSCFESLLSQKNKHANINDVHEHNRFHRLFNTGVNHFCPPPFLTGCRNNIKKLCRVAQIDTQDCERFVEIKNIKNSLLQKIDTIGQDFKCTFFDNNELAPLQICNNLLVNINFHLPRPGLRFSKTDKLIVMNALNQYQSIRLDNKIYIYSKVKHLKIDNSLNSSAKSVIRIVMSSLVADTYLGNGSFGFVECAGSPTSSGMLKDNKVLKNYYDHETNIPDSESGQNYKTLSESNEAVNIVKARFLDKRAIMMKRFDIDLHKKRIELGNSPIPLEYILSIMKDCLKGLGFIHSHAMCHQDIKSSNILLKNDRAYITDFDFLCGENCSDITAFTNGTYHYIFLNDQILIWKQIEEAKNNRLPDARYPPEIISKMINLKQQIDCRALGLVFLEFITGLSSTKLYKIDKSQEEVREKYDFHPWSHNLDEKMRKKGLEAIEKAKSTFGSTLIDFVLSIVHPSDKSFSAHEYLSALDGIDMRR